MAFLHKRVDALPSAFGEALRELREQRGYTVEDLCRLTGIHPSVLVALEEDRLKDLIDPCYAERHVKTVVHLLEGHETYFLEKYYELLIAKGISRSVPKLLRPRVRPRDLFVGSRLVAIFGFIAAAAVLAAYVIWQIVLLSSAPALVILAPPDGLQTSDPRIEILGETDPEARVEVNGQPAVVNPSGQFQLFVDLPRGLTTLRIEARRRFGSSVTLERYVTYERLSSGVTTTKTE